MTGPLAGFASPLTVPASWVYGLTITARNARFDRGNGVASVDVPVISVGNLTTGGVGKTPMVAWIADLLVNQGRLPVIAMRGYGARAGESSDEQAEYAHRLPDVPVVAKADRLAAIRAVRLRCPAIDCVLLDDGFQHRRIRRDLDLVLIDASRNTFGDRLLPAGHLREPPASLRRADAVVMTRAQGVDSSIAGAIQRHHGRAPVAWSCHTWTHLAVHHPDERREPVDWLRGKRLLTMLGVGHPRSIIQQLQQAGAEVAVNLPVRDHQRYSRAKLAVAEGLCEGLDAMVMTPKDWVKAQLLIDLSRWPVPVVIPQLAIDVFDGAEALRRLILDAVAR
ncbi:MAG: tetraacyldisaccharide 4'-kinase [Planctomycetota bacterium]|nr:tetraacyldisaccharide 4'-kinase [Planctomycetota bacterium]